MVYKTEADLLNTGTFSEVNGTIEINDRENFRNRIVDDLVDTMILGDDAHLKRLCYWIAYEAALAFGVVPSSIQGFYEAKAKEDLKPFTVPAMNLRTLTFDTARAVFRAAKKIKAGAFIFEIAKSEIGYTDQRPLEYSSMLMLAAIKEGFLGPLFIQGDHFQVKASSYLKDKNAEVAPLKDLIKEAVGAGFYNIDIDSSTLVDLSRETIDEQQLLNFEVCAEFTRFIRGLQPQGVDISVGGEIGEVGKKNSTPEELKAFMNGYKATLGDSKGISKISIQTGTSHGGVVLPDGSIAKVSIDFDTLKNLSEIAKKDFAMAGAVQHGASTLPNEAFHHFPETGCCEIHLATGFQNMVYDYLPLPLKETIYAWLHENCAAERKPEMTDDQFIYTTRKKALGPFKKQIHSLNADVKNKISEVLEKEFSFLFDQLKVQDTAELIDRYISPVKVGKKKADFLKEEKDLGELEGAD